MDVRCDRCETEYELDDAIVTDAGASVQCSTCGHTFIVTRRPSSPLNLLGLGQHGGAAESAGPTVPEWTLSTDDGKVHRFRDLNLLQKWIVERKVSRTERISRGGGPWLALEDVVELTPFFNVVDEADRARASTGITGGMPTAPTFPAPSGGWSSAPAARSPSGGIRFGEPQRPGATPPPVPLDARRPLSEDGPTVPNRRLPAELAGALGEEMEIALIAAAESVDALDAPPPARAPRPLPGMSVPKPALRTSSSRPGTSGAQPTAIALAASANEGIRRAGASAPRSSSRPDLPATHNITAETHPLERERLEPPSHGVRNATVVVALLILGAAGAYWQWKDQQASATRATVTTAASGVERMPAAAPSRPADETSGRALAPSVQGPSPQAAPRAGGDNAAVPALPTLPTLPTPARADLAASKDLVAGGHVDPSREGGKPVIGASAPRAGRAPVEAAAGRASAAASYERLVAEADRLLDQGKSARADKLYAQALAARPDGVSALTGAAYVLLDRQRHFKAIETFRRALAIQPTFGPALFGIAESYRARGDTAQALGAYRQYLAIAPTGTDAPAARRQIKDLESTGSTAAPETPAAD